MSKKLNPAIYVINQFGGMRATARAVGRSPSAVHRWKTRKQIPQRACATILKLAKKRGLSITAENLIFGK